MEKTNIIAHPENLLWQEKQKIHLLSQKKKK